MKHSGSFTRRNFLQTSAVGAAGLAIGGAGLTAPVSAAGGWVNGATKINPAIDNLRVVYCKDDAVSVDPTTKAPKDPTKWDIQSQNNLVSVTVVDSMLDKMAKMLAQNTDVAAAWKIIFRKPDAKAWSAVNVAIKVNTINFSCCPRLAVIDKMCRVMIDLGVLPANITIYDACTSPTGAYDTTYGRPKLPTGVVISGSLGTRISATIPCDNPLKQTGHATSHTFNCCSRLIQNTTGKQDKVDILINLAVNKGHGQSDKGGETLCQKNHTGSIKFNCPNLDEMIAENKCEPIIGTEGPGVPFRQQLCIVDAIYSATTGPGDAPDKMTHTLIMGTFAGAVDFLTCKKLREPDMGCTHTQTALNAHITGYGYTDAERLDLLNKTPAQNDGKGWVDANGTVETVSEIKPSTQSVVSFQASNSSFRLASANFRLPHGINMLEVHIHTADGKRIFGKVFSASDKLVWNCKNVDGKNVSAGTYLVTLTGKSFQQTQKIRLSK